MIDMEWLRRLIALVDDSEIDSLEISRFATRVRISKSPPVHVLGGTPGAGGNAALPAAPSGSAAGGGGSAASGATGGGSAGQGMAVEEAGVERADHLHEVKSPMVGTFYRAPAPDAPPYVEVGDHVRKGQTLCILEAMKLMNELESESAGVIREICVQNAEPVEFGQILFRIEPDEAG